MGTPALVVSEKVLINGRGFLPRMKLKSYLNNTSMAKKIEFSDYLLEIATC